MKRKNKIIIQHPSMKRSSSIEDFAGARCSDNCPDTKISIESEEDMSRVKRGRFLESKVDHHPNAKARAISIPSEAATRARSNTPKTSEFAFFKKIKEKACNHSYQLQKESDEVKNVKSRESKGDTTFMFEQRRSYLKSSLHVEKARPSNQQHLPSPLVDASKESGIKYAKPTFRYITPPLPLNKVKPGSDCYSQSLGGRSRNSAMHNQEIFKQSRSYLRSSFHVEKDRHQQQHLPSPLVDKSKGLGINHVEPTYKNITLSLPLNKVKPGRHDFYSSLDCRLRNSGNHCSEKGIFSSKRQKLRQMVADTTLLEVDDPCSKGSSLVSVLLSRLFPENTENKLCQSSKSRELQNDIRQQQTVLPNSGMHVDRISKTRTLNLNVTANWPYFDDACVKYRSSPDISRVTPVLDIISSYSPSTSHAARTSTEYQYNRNLHNEPCERVTCFLRESDSLFLESFEGYGFTPSGHHYLLDYNEPESRLQPQNHLLTWHDNSEHYEQNIAGPSFKTDTNFPLLEATCNADIVYGGHNELVCLPPLVSENTQNFPILPHYPLDSFHSDFQSHLGDEKYQGVLTLPRSPNYLKLIEDCTSENTLESSIIELPPREPFQFPTRLKFTSEWKFLSMSDSSEECRINDDVFCFLLKEGLWSPPLRRDNEDDRTYNSNSIDFCEGSATGHDWSASNFKQSRETDSSLLLHDSSWDLYERETYIADVDDHYDE